MSPSDFEDFWDPGQFDFSDPVHRDIWERSPSIQCSIQTPASLSAPGSYGPQQAMIEDVHRHLLEGRPCLPWVPDLVGNDWRRNGRLIVVGAAYAGFIREYSRRGRTMTIRDAANLNLADFQSLFLRDVVQGDANYYGPIAELVAPSFKLADILVMDLARVSLVWRGDGPPENRGDRSSLSANDFESEVFARYVECAASVEWNWARMKDSPARCIVALGFTVEHGLLRHFRRCGCSIRRSSDGKLWDKDNPRWPRRYASGALPQWINGRGAWWEIRCPPLDRTWRLLPVYHPSGYGRRDPNYSKSRELLRCMCEV